MILVDANLLIYAHVTDFPEHDAARAWLDDRLAGTVGVGMPWPCLLAFVRIVTNHRVFRQPVPIEAAWKQVGDWLDCRPVWVPEPTERHAALLGQLLTSARAKPSLVPDAHLAALAMEFGLVLQSTDADFGRFPGLRWENPLA